MALYLRTQTPTRLCLASDTVRSRVLSPGFPQIPHGLIGSSPKSPRILDIAVLKSHDGLFFSAPFI